MPFYMVSFNEDPEYEVEPTAIVLAEDEADAVAGARYCQEAEWEHPLELVRVTEVDEDEYFAWNECPAHPGVMT